jgi:hypothetical protein
MDLQQAILEEHSKAQTETIVRYVGSDAKRFAELMTLFLGKDKKVVQRSGWPLSYCVERHPDLITPHFKHIIPLLTKPPIHNAVHRNIMRLLQHVAIPKKYHGQVMNACFEFITSNDTEVAIKAFALTVLDGLSKEYPDIKGELKLVIEERWPYETAAFKVRAKKIIK